MSAIAEDFGLIPKILHDSKSLIKPGELGYSRLRSHAGPGPAGKTRFRAYLNPEVCRILAFWATIPPTLGVQVRRLQGLRRQPSSQKPAGMK